MTASEKAQLAALHDAAAQKFAALNACLAEDPESAELDRLQQDWEDAELGIKAFRDKMLLDDGG